MLVCDAAETDCVYSKYLGGVGFDLGRKKLNGMRELCVYEAQVVDVLTSQRDATPRPSVFWVSGSCLWTLTGLGARICFSRDLCLHRTTQT